MILARAGIRPELIDRHAGERDLVCGGFLSWDTVESLRALGLDPAELGAPVIRRVRLVAGRRVVEADLPRAAAGLSRRRLDSALLGLAEQAGARVRRGIAARAWENGELRLADGERIVPEALFLATGKHELRGAARTPVPQARALSAGLRTALPADARLREALEGVIELHLFDGGYAGLLLQEDGQANFCLSASQSLMADGREALIERLAISSPLLADRLAARTGAWEAIAAIPYGWRARTSESGLFRTGDQAAVIASLAGDGMAIALASGKAAATAWIEAGPEGAAFYQAHFAGKARRALAAGEALRKLAGRAFGRRLMLGAAAAAPALVRGAARATRL